MSCVIASADKGAVHDGVTAPRGWLRATASRWRFPATCAACAKESLNVMAHSAQRNAETPTAAADATAWAPLPSGARTDDEEDAVERGGPEPATGPAAAVAATAVVVVVTPWGLYDTTTVGRCMSVFVTL